MNFEKIHTFTKGLSFDLEQRAEKADSFQYGLNGRLYSSDGVLSYSGIKGSIEIYRNADVKKYLGGFAFEDQMVLIAKYTNRSNNIEDGSYFNYYIKNQSITYNWPIEGQPVKPSPGLLLEPGLIQETIIETELEDNTPDSAIDDSNETCDDDSRGREEDLATIIRRLYKLSSIDIPNYEACLLTEDNTTPQNNKDLSDVIIVITKNHDNTLTGEVVWNGYLDLDINRKINMVGIDENSNYKRVYFTDNLNQLRTFNLKDKGLSYNKPEHFNLVQDTMLLQPTVEQIKENGQLKAMSVQYIHYLTTQNGQVSAFSPMSELVEIVEDNSDQKFAGGDIDTLTNKSIDVLCTIINSDLYDQVECIALEYEVNGPPTNIVSLGIKSSQDLVRFSHNGTESTVQNTTILAELLTSKNTWKYCSDLTIKNNKLIAAGLRNEPYPVSAKYIEDLFLLKGWNEFGSTHDCLINPSPTDYKYIDPANESKLFTISKTLYTQLMGFGNFRLTLMNTTTNESIYQDFINETELYQDFVQEINDWLNSVDLTIKFPNLTVEIDNGSLLFKRTNDATLTDIGVYQFQANTSQLIVELDNEYELNDDPIPTTELTHGAVSYGYNEGTGIRLSWNVSTDELMTKDVEEYTSGFPYSLKAPSLKKGFMKNEIYRLSFTGFKNGNPLFAIPLGDIEAPNMDDQVVFINDGGERDTNDHQEGGRGRYGVPTAHKSKHKNQFVLEDKLYAQRVVMKVEVRLGCDLKDFIDSYQIQYVERTEENRTIIAQGISGPLQRCVQFDDINLSGEVVAPDVFRKWSLPYLGGPLHEKFGLEAYDELGENYDNPPEKDPGDEYMIDRAKRRYVTNRRLFYFDAPDLIYDKVTSNLAEIANAEVLGRLKTDHNRETLSDMNVIESTYSYSDKDLDPFEGVSDVKTFSRKIYEGGKSENNYKKVFAGDLPEEHPYWLNFSVFSNFEFFSGSHKIIESHRSQVGEVMPSATLDMKHEISNNALTHGDPAMNYSEAWRAGKRYYKDNEYIYQNEFNNCANIASGYTTVFLKTENALFTDDLIGEEDIFVECDYAGGYVGGTYGEVIGKTSDAHALINLKLSNQDTVYGGRTRYAFSKNIFAPLSPIIPVITKTNQAQISLIEGDTYMSLFMRTKSDYHNRLEHEEFTMSSGIDNSSGETITEYNRPNGWAYAVVLETTVEERLTSGFRQYRQSTPQDFEVQIDEYMNPAYKVANNLKSYIPRPFNFKENPLLMNIIAASKVKLAGEFYDSFSQFLANDFYELEQQYGAISNVTTYLDELYVIQALATNNVVMEPSDTITTDQGRDIQLATGTGQVFHSSKIISKYGTNIRRAFAEGVLGFSFYDETKNEFVKIIEPLASGRLIGLHLRNEFETDPVVDSEGWYDDKYKESNLNLTTQSGKNYTLSYNEALGAFNGWYDYQASLYQQFNNRVFAPAKETAQGFQGQEWELHELNRGNFLNLLKQQKTLKLGIIVNGDKKGVKIYRGIEALINIKYPVKSFRIYDNLDINDVRTVEGTHFRYKIREGIHTVPLQNINDRVQKRGEWAYIEVEIESINNQKIDLVSLVAFLRDSSI